MASDVGVEVERSSRGRSRTGVKTIMMMNDDDDYYIL